MLVPFDSKTKTVKAAIKVLITLCRPPETLRSGESSIDLHSRQREHIRKQKEIALQKNCNSEVPCSLVLTRNGINFRITGRADLLSETDRTVTEVKTADPLPETPAPDHLLQVLFYAHALQAKEICIVYTSPDTKESIEYNFDVSEERMTSLWNEFIEDVSLFVLEEWERHTGLVSALESFRFPFSTIRPGQRDIIRSVTEVGTKGKQLLLQAPTGTGKTVAVLSGAIPPAVRKWNILFFLTSKNTQKKIVAETVQRIIDQGFPLRTIVVSSRESSCPMGMSRCNPMLCSYAEDFNLRIKESGIIKKLTNKVLITPEDLVSESVSAGVCPFELSLFISQRCDLVACDYNYVFDPGIKLKRFFASDETAQRCSLLVDEAANLPARVRKIWSPEIRASWIDKTLDFAEGNKELTRLLLPWKKLFDKHAARPWPYKEVEVLLPEETKIPHINSTKWRRELGGNPDAPMEAVSLNRAVTVFSRVLERRDHRFHLMAEKDGSDTLIRWYCTDSSLFIAEEHTRCHSTTCFSATLEPTSHFAFELGLDEKDALDAVVVGWPFPKENLTVWVDTAIDTRWKHREQHTELLIERFRGALSKKEGTWMVFFPSFGWMEKIALAAQKSGISFIAQEREMDEKKRSAFVETINGGGNLIFAVAGGVFGEGVDLTIPDLSGCFVIGPSLPSVSLRQKLMQDMYTDTGRNGFLHAFVIPGINRVIQAAGRLIRNSDQKADLILVGRRFAREPYTSHLPEHWFPLRIVKNNRVFLKRLPHNRKETPSPPS